MADNDPRPYDLEGGRGQGPKMKAAARRPPFIANGFGFFGFAHKIMCSTILSAAHPLSPATSLLFEPDPWLHVRGLSSSSNATEIVLCEIYCHSGES